MRRNQHTVLVVNTFCNHPEACKGNIVEVEKKPTNTFLNSYTGSYGALTDRDISEDTATVTEKSHYPTNDVSQHIYPFFNGNEIVETKTRFVENKNFFAGAYEGTGLLGEQLEQWWYLTITEGECDAMLVMN